MMNESIGKIDVDAIEEHRAVNPDETLYKLEDIRDQIKESFLNLCVQFSAMGQQFVSKQLRELLTNRLGASPVDEASGKLLQQYNQMGEQLKQLGAGIDLLGGDPVLVPADGKEKDDG